MRHQRIVLVILGYIIGFTTAYIGFGINTGSQSYESKNYVSNTVSDSKSEVSKENIDKAGPVFYDEIGLFMVVDGEEVIVSARQYEGIEPGPGFHFDVPFYALSPDRNLVHYCELETSSSKECKHYIYNSVEHVTYVVKVEGEVLTTDPDTFEYTWTADNRITNEKNISNQAEKPWKLSLGQ